ncbi:MAG: hypothetical protein FWG25_04145, partial [Promicromonosporaceae bacterium]|nr:hypothetical protein [Promicromonosporaceae bacterium]
MPPSSPLPPTSAYSPPASPAIPAERNDYSRFGRRNASNRYALRRGAGPVGTALFWVAAIGIPLAFLILFFAIPTLNLLLRGLAPDCSVNTRDLTRSLT